MKCYGDSTVLSKLKLPKVVPGETLIDLLGPIGEKIPATFKRVEKQVKQFAIKYEAVSEAEEVEPEVTAPALTVAAPPEAELSSM